MLLIDEVNNKLVHKQLPRLDGQQQKDKIAEALRGGQVHRHS